jgi:hypothetical protein
MAGGPDHTLVDCCMRGRSHVGLGSFDTRRLLADVGDSTCKTHIAEVSKRERGGGREEEGGRRRMYVY